jgi:hypothetical protein
MCAKTLKEPFGAMSTIVVPVPHPARAGARKGLGIDVREDLEGTVRRYVDDCGAGALKIFAVVEVADQNVPAYEPALGLAHHRDAIGIDVAVGGNRRSDRADAMEPVQDWAAVARERRGCGRKTRQRTDHGNYEPNSTQRLVHRSFLLTVAWERGAVLEARVFRHVEPGDRATNEREPGRGHAIRRRIDAAHADSRRPVRGRSGE